MKKSIVSMFLALIMLFSIFAPYSAFAEEAEQVIEEVPVVEIATDISEEVITESQPEDFAGQELIEPDEPLEQLPDEDIEMSETEEGLLEEAAAETVISEEPITDEFTEEVPEIQDTEIPEPGMDETEVGVSDNEVVSGTEEPEELSEEPIEGISDESGAEEELLEIPEEPIETPITLQASTESFIVTLYADAGVLPADSILEVSVLKDASKADWVASGIKDKLNAQAVLDIKVISNGVEVQPNTEKGNVKLSFSYKNDADANMDIYHISDGATEKLPEKASENGANVTVETDGFSYYVVEFHNDGAEYILDGDSETKLVDILAAINIPGTAKQAKSSNDKLFSIIERDGELYVSANQAFNTEETLTVFMTDGIEYIIRVTDASYEHYATVDNKYHTHTRADGSVGSYTSEPIFLYHIDGKDAFCVEVGVYVGGPYTEASTLAEAIANREIESVNGYKPTSSKKAEKWYAYVTYFKSSWFDSQGGLANVAMGIWQSLNEAVPASNYAGRDGYMAVWNAFEDWYASDDSDGFGSNTELYVNKGNGNQKLCIFKPYKPTLGDLAIVKVSANTAITNNNSCYSLAGAVYTVKNSSGTKVGTITTDASGKGSLNNLPAGSYTIEETTAPKGFAKNSGTNSFTITAGKTTTLNGTGVLRDKPQNDPVGMLVKKLNKETGTAVKFGDGSLAGAQFTVKYYDGYYTAANLPGTADRTWVLKTDENGRVRFNSDYLVSGSAFYLDGLGSPCFPLGTVTIQETKAPAGFKLDNTLNVQQITSDGVLETVTAFNEITVSEEEFFGKIELTKMLVENGSKTPENGAEFEVYLTSAGSYAKASAAEKDYLVTDENGKAVSKSLPYGKYTVHQVKGTDGYQLAATDKTISITKDGSTVPVAFDNLKMEIGTKASGTEGEKVLNVATDITIVDTVSYKNLNVGKEYTVCGILMDKATGEPILVDGAQVTAEKQFTASAANGTVEMEFTFNAVPIKGKSIVVFENLYEGNVEVAVHADITDEEQTVEFTEPKIGTTAKVEEEKDTLINPETVLVDTVEYENLSVGKEYTVKGVLMDKETGEPILVDGEQVTAQTVFTAAAASGSVDVTFSFNSLELKGKSVVVFETVYENDVEVAVHADIEDEGQTVRFREPEIGTTAAAPDGDKKLNPYSEITLVDTVSYTDLKPGKEYTVCGILMDKETGEPLLVNDEVITAETAFIPEEPDGTVDVTFIFDASELQGKTIVVFEDLYYGNVELAVHADIEDEGQTVTVRTPEIGTTAKGENGEKDLVPNQKITIVDTVSYTDLKPGTEYTVKGILMDKATGEPILVDGAQVTAETAFTPEAADGAVDVTFTFDGSLLDGKSVVVFEELYDGDILVTTHADITDEGQTVSFHTPPEVKTGVDTFPLGSVIVIGCGLFALLGIAVFFFFNRRKRTEK